MPLSKFHIRVAPLRATGLERLQQFLEAVALDGLTVKSNVYRVTNAGDAYRTLRQVEQRNRDAKTFIVDLTTEDSELLLRKIVSHNRRNARTESGVGTGSEILTHRSDPTRPEPIRPAGRSLADRQQLYCCNAVVTTTIRLFDYNSTSFRLLIIRHKSSF